MFVGFIGALLSSMDSVSLPVTLHIPTALSVCTLPTLRLFWTGAHSQQNPFDLGSLLGSLVWLAKPLASMSASYCLVRLAASVCVVPLLIGSFSLMAFAHHKVGYTPLLL